GLAPAKPQAAAEVLLAMTRTLPLFAVALLFLTASARAGDDAKLQALLKDLDATDSSARYKTIMALAEFGPKAEPAIPALVKSLESKNEDLRLAAALTLGKIGKKSLPVLSELLHDSDADVRYYAVWAVGLVVADAAGASC